jgi:HAD superfamily hydrolase (TIGR01549 family)
MSAKTPIQVVIFDLFGKLVECGTQHNPFRQLLTWARDNGRRSHPDDARVILTTNGDVTSISRALGIEPTVEVLEQVEERITKDLATLQLYSDVNPTLMGLIERNIQVGICSNLAQPYGRSIDTLLGRFRIKRFLSYEASAVKPEPAIYQAICNDFNCPPSQCLFVGDTLDADFLGPQHFGMRALHLKRNEPAMSAHISSLGEVLGYIDHLDWVHSH